MFGRSAVSDGVHVCISESDTLTHLNAGQSSTGNIYNDLHTLHTIRTCEPHPNAVVARNLFVRNFLF